MKHELTNGASVEVQDHYLELTTPTDTNLFLLADVFRVVVHDREKEAPYLMLHFSCSDLVLRLPTKSCDDLYTSIKERWFLCKRL